MRLYAIHQTWVNFSIPQSRCGRWVNCLLAIWVNWNFRNLSKSFYFLNHAHAAGGIVQLQIRKTIIWDEFRFGGAGQEYQRYVTGEWHHLEDIVNAILSTVAQVLGYMRFVSKCPANGLFPYKWSYNLPVSSLPLSEPEMPGNVTITATNVGTNKYDLNISWMQPEYEPNHYEIKMFDLNPLMYDTPNSMQVNVSGVSNCLFDQLFFFTKSL